MHRPVDLRGRGPQLRTDPQALLTLLQLQEADLAMARLKERGEHLPEAATARSLAAAFAAARDAAVVRRTEASDLQREVRKIEDEVEWVRARAKRDADLLVGGVGSAKQLLDLQHEIASLEKRQSDLEDAQLELMERAEAAAAAEAAAVAERDRLAAESEQARQAAARALQELKAEYQQIRSRRADLEAQLPADLLRLYEGIRAKRGGIGAAEFADDRCGGCQLEMIPADLAALKAAPANEVIQCEECGRILVRTALIRR